MTSQPSQPYPILQCLLCNIAHAANPLWAVKHHLSMENMESSLSLSNFPFSYTPRKLTVYALMSSLWKLTVKQVLGLGKGVIIHGFWGYP